MKYFTPAWHSGNLDDEASERVFRDYQRHLTGLLPSLPPEVQRLATSANIHDGLLQEANVDPEQTSLRLVLRCGDNQVSYFNLGLEYAKIDFSSKFVKEFAQLSAIPMTRNQPPYPSVALYQEVDQEGDLLVHRILFWQTDWRQRQAQRRLRRQKRDGRRQIRYCLRLRGNNYRELTIRFKELRLRITPREGRHSTK